MRLTQRERGQKNVGGWECLFCLCRCSFHNLPPSLTITSQNHLASTIANDLPIRVWLILRTAESSDDTGFP